MGKPEATLQTKKQSKQAHTCSRKLVFEQLPVMKILLKTKNPRLRAELLNISPNTIHALCAVARNIQSGNVPMNSKKLGSIKSELGVLASPSVSLSRKRALLLKRQKGGQKGGFLQFLAPLLPTIVSAVSSLFGGRSEK